MYKPLTKENVKDFKNFKYSEFKCHCGGKYCKGYPVPFSYDLAANLQKVRNHFKKAVHITSPLRCTKWNSKQGGVKNSKHTKGWACDFYISGVKYSQLAKFVKTLPYFHYCYNVSGNVIHYDITPPAYTEPETKTDLEIANEKISELEKELEALNLAFSELEKVNEELKDKMDQAVSILKD